MMKQTKKLITIVGTLTVVLSVSSVQAIQTYLDVDLFDRSEGWLTQGEELTDVFDIVDEGGPFDIGGFDPTTEDVFEAWVSIGLYDDPIVDWREQDPTELAVIRLDSEMIASGRVEWGLFGSVGLWEVQGDLLVDLNDDGRLTYSIQSREGDFGVGFAILSARAQSPQERKPVPETGSTLIMLGMSMLLAETIRRKKNT